MLFQKNNQIGNSMNQFKNNYQNEYEVVKKKFRHAYVLKPSFNFSPLKPYCERIIYAVEGYANAVDILRTELETSFANFDAERDVLIPVGSAQINLLAGTVLQRLISEREPIRPSFAMGIYSRPDSEDGEWVQGDYIFWRVHLDGVTESYEIIQ